MTSDLKAKWRHEQEAGNSVQIAPQRPMKLAPRFFHHRVGVINQRKNNRFAAAQNGWSLKIELGWVGWVLLISIFDQNAGRTIRNRVLRKLLVPWECIVQKLTPFYIIFRVIFFKILSTCYLVGEVPFLFAVGYNLSLILWVNI